MKLPKLLNCPFCNGTAEFTIYSHNKKSNGVAVRCCICGAEAQRVYYNFMEGRKELGLLELIKRVDLAKAQTAEMWNKRYSIEV